MLSYASQEMWYVVEYELLTGSEEVCVMKKVERRQSGGAKGYWKRLLCVIWLLEEKHDVESVTASQAIRPAGSCFHQGTSWSVHKQIGRNKKNFNYNKHCKARTSGRPCKYLRSWQAGPCKKTTDLL